MQYNNRNTSLRAKPCALLCLIFSKNGNDKQPGLLRFWNAPILAALVVSGLFATVPRETHAACTTGLNFTFNCIDDQSAGISINRETLDGKNLSPYTINVNSLSLDITPVALRSGIDLRWGGATGNSNKVNQVSAVINTDKAIKVTGNSAYGIRLSSVGGSDPETSFFGTQGGDGGQISIQTLGGLAITTLGNQAHGILADSRGGHGGNGVGGINNGGYGGNGGSGGIVDVDSTASINTEGNQAHGIFARSQGGSNGNGGNAVSITALGGWSGFGPVNNNAGTVTVNNYGNIMTMDKVEVPVKNKAPGYDDGAHGIYAISLGGNGGNGGDAYGLLAYAGWGSTGGNGGNVVVTNNGNITASGADSKAIFAKSMGGNAGNAGTAGGVASTPAIALKGGDGSMVTVNNYAQLKTDGDNASTIDATSLGGYGGSSGNIVTVGLGFALAFGNTLIPDFNFPAGNGGEVVVVNHIGAIGGSGSIFGNLQTSGDYSNGISASSIGGGGGKGGYSVSVSGAPYFDASVALGGDGGTGGAGGKVTVVNSSHIITKGRNSSGILADSTGGGGGTGGASIAVGGCIGDCVSLSVSLGGTGGKGGNGEIVTVTSNGRITTGIADKVTSLYNLPNSNFNYQDLVTLQANQIITVSDLLSTGKEDLVAIGIDDTAATHLLENAFAYLEVDKESHGIYARSIGGGGGDGGLSIAGTVIASKNTAVGAAISVGGNGGVSGDGKKVTVNNHSVINTHGWSSHGIYATSISNGGGNAGGSIAGGLVLGKKNSANGYIGVSVGGSGGDGAQSGDVVVTNLGAIKTTGFKANGIYAKSIANGGGDGALAVSGSLSITQGNTSGTAKINLAVGGYGGNGNKAGKVTVTNSSTIDTFGLMSGGIVAESIGGSGGQGAISIAAAGAVNGKNLNLDVSVGGGGGTGSTGGEVKVENKNSIHTRGRMSNGVTAQSIGGSGGSGEISYAAGASFLNDQKKGSKNVNLNVAVGGKGGSGNTGGYVEVINNGLAAYSGGVVIHSIRTEGLNSHGIVAQSVGGGGGRGGSARTLSLNTLVKPQSSSAEDSLGNFDLAVGGYAADGGHGGEVSVKSKSNIFTASHSSHGIYAQSIGGGGGSGGEGADGLGLGGPIGGVVETLLGFSLDHTPILKDVKIRIGGSGGSSGDGGVVTVSQEIGRIETKGKGSFGINAHSVGGGGGQGGNGVPGLTQIAVGGEGGASGHGGDVTVNLGNQNLHLGPGHGTRGYIDTFGDSSWGIFAQSVGGGGGLGGKIDREGIVSDTLRKVGIDPNATGITLGNGNAGDGGVVNVTAYGNIHTRGVGSIGIIAQSVGGGGGLIGGAEIFGAYAGSAGGHGKGKEVKVDLIGNITAVNGTGIYAQSAAGSATFDAIKQEQVLAVNDPNFRNLLDPVYLIPFVGPPLLLERLTDLKTNLQSNIDNYRSTNQSGAIDILVNGNITAGDVGIYAQSLGATGNGDITVSVKNGHVQGGDTKVGQVIRSGLNVDSYTGVGVKFADGKDNTLTIENTGTVSAKSGIAVIGLNGNEVIDNFGIVTGSVHLGTGTNAFHNQENATFNSGKVVTLGNNNWLINLGTLSPGQVGQVETTTLTGSMKQTTAGIYVADVDLEKNVADFVDVSGISILKGKVQVNLLNPGSLTSGKNQHTILTSQAGITDRLNLGLDFVSSPLIDYQLEYPNQNDVVLSYTVDFAPAGLAGNPSAVGQYINAIQSAGGTSGFSSITSYLVSLPDAASITAAYKQLGAESLMASASTATLSDMRFSDAMHSCRVREGEYRFVKEGECSWFRFNGSRLDQDQTATNAGFSRDSRTLAAGVQKELNESWHAGFGFSVESSTLDVADNTKSDGDMYSLGLIAKRNMGAAALSASINAGYGKYDTARVINIPTPGMIAISEQSIGLASAHLRMSQDLEYENTWYLRPTLDAGWTYIRHGSFNETGAGAANLNAERGHDTLMSLQTGIEFGREYKTVSGTLIRPYGIVGLTQFLSGTTTGITASLQGAPVGTAPFTTQSTMDKRYADLTLGVDVLSEKGTTFRFIYDGKFSKNSDSHTASMKLSIPF